MRKQFDVASHLRMWEKAVDVQQHFNDIGWRIRALGLTVLTFTFGATGFTYANSDYVRIGTASVTPAVLVPLVGIFLWISFWFTDAGWYHKLLIGAVKDGIRLERLLTEHGIEAGLGGAIGRESPIWIYKRQPKRERVAGANRQPITLRGVPFKLHSKHKLNLFYVGVVILLSITSVLLCFAPSSAKQEAPPTVVVTHIP